METIYNLKLLINVESLNETSYINFQYSRDRTIGELNNFIKHTLAGEGLEGEIYYLINQYSREILIEYLLGGILFPNEITIRESLIENNTVFYAECHYIQNEVGEQEQQVEDDIENINSNVPTSSQLPHSRSSDITQYLIDRISTNRSSNTINHLATLSNILFQTNLNSELDVLLNTRNRIHAPMLHHNNNVTNGLPLISYLNADAQQISNSMFGLVNIMGALNVPHRMEDISVGILKADLEALKVAEYTNFENTNTCDTCSICIEKFKEEDMCRELKCKHLFHRDCIDHWLDGNIKCPVCRMETGRGVPKF